MRWGIGEAGSEASMGVFSAGAYACFHIMFSYPGAQRGQTLPREGQRSARWDEHLKKGRGEEGWCGVNKRIRSSTFCSRREVSGLLRATYLLASIQSWAVFCIDRLMVDPKSTFENCGTIVHDFWAISMSKAPPIKNRFVQLSPERI